MSKAGEKALALFAKNSKPEFREAFEVRPTHAVGNFGAMFGAVKLLEEEEKEIEYLLSQDFKSEGMREEQVGRDIHSLIEITSQIRSIERQSIVLHGERIARARDILKAYKEGAFTAWMMTAYGNRQTPYSLLQYYEFYRDLSKELQNRMQSMPRKAAYALASRSGDIERKKEILQNYHNLKQEKIITIIQETFPLDAEDRRRGKDSTTALIEQMQKSLETLIRRKNSLSKRHKEALASFKTELESLL